MNIPDLIFENLLSVFFGLKIRYLSCKPWIRDGKNRIRAKHPGSATLANSINFNSSHAGIKSEKKIKYPQHATAHND